MAVGVAGAGFLGIALETAAAPGVWVTPAKWIPIESESLKHTQATVWRRPIQGIVDVRGGVAGDSHVAGDITMEVLEDAMPYFLYASRTTGVRSGTTPNFTYSFTPSAAAVPARTCSITVIRNGLAFAYVGCVVSSSRYTIDGGLLKVTFSIMGMQELTQAGPFTPGYSTVQPFGAGQYNIQIPTATQVFDCDGFDLAIEDNAAPQQRLQNLGSRAQFITYGERSVGLTTTRDFQSRAEYDAFKALTASSLTLVATKGVNNSIQFDLPVTVKSDYTVGLSGQGDLLRASTEFMGIFDSTTNKSYGITLKCQEDVVPA